MYQGRRGRWPLGFGVMSDFLLLFITIIIILPLEWASHVA